MSSEGKSNGGSITGRLAGKVGIVSGAGRGIGAATVMRLAEEGAAVVGIDLDGAEETAAAAGGVGGRAIGISGSVADPKIWRSAVDRAVEQFGHVDGLANVAGITLPQRGRPDNAIEVEDEDMELLLDVNLRGPLYGMKAVLPLMRERKSGAIVNVTSGAAIIGIPNHAGYSSTKGGLGMLTRQVAVEYGPDGIRAVSIAPGAIDTPMNAATPDHIRAEIAAGTPLRRMGRPEEVAGLISFLLSDDAAFITATEVVIDGGVTAQ